MYDRHGREIDPDDAPQPYVAECDECGEVAEGWEDDSGMFSCHACIERENLREYEREQAWNAERDRELQREIDWYAENDPNREHQ